MGTGAVSIPFGADTGPTGYSEDLNISFGKLYSGGTDIYLFVQNKVKRTTVSTTVFADCSKWIVFDVDGSHHPLEGASLNYQEEPNIIWKALAPGTTPTQITSSPNAIAPATIVDCIQILGVDGSYQCSVKGSRTNNGMGDDFSIHGLFEELGLTLSTPEEPEWSMSWNENRPRTDWWVYTQSGRGYTVGATLGSGAKNQYFAVAYTANARGDVTTAETTFTILEA